MLDARFSQLYFGQSLHTLQRRLSAIAGLLVSKLFTHCSKHWLISMSLK